MQRYTPAYAALIRNDEVKQGELTGSLRRASDTVISSQAPPLAGKVQRLSARNTVPSDGMGSALHPHSQETDEDIVHPPGKLGDTCNPLVAGSNPAPGAKQNASLYGAFCF